MSNKIKFSDSDICEIIRLYTSGEVVNVHKLAGMFHVGHKRVREILKENDISINKRGAKRLYPEEFPVKYMDDEEFTYVAIHKKTGEYFTDYNNVSGVLSKYVQAVDGVVAPRLDSQKKRYFTETGNYWYEEYFDIVKKSFDELGFRKCPYCSEMIQGGKFNIKYKNHLKKSHKITDIEKHVIDFPDDYEIFSHEISKIRYYGNKDNFVECKICGQKMAFVNSFHLKNKHGISLSDYKTKYCHEKYLSQNLRASMSSNMRQKNADGIMTSYTSKYEGEVKNFLSSIGVDYQSNRQILIGKEIDILSHEHKIGVEFDGCKWHTEWFGKKDRKYHLDKTIKCNEKGYGLIHIFEDEWVYSSEIVKNKLRHLFGKNKNLEKIPGRKTTVVVLNNQDSNDFLNKHHIQGQGQSTISLGALYNGQLIAVMLFKVKKNGGNEYELTRFASDNNYICQGVASKIFSYFIKNYNPASIVSFADRRWTLNVDDNLYTKLGFDFIESTDPDYRYYNERVDRYKRFHKFGFRKQILNKKYGFDLSMTETEMVKTLGYDRIWDCGLFKYEWKKARRN